MAKNIGTQGFLIEPGHQRTQENCERYCRKAKSCCRKGTDIPTNEIGEFRYACGAHHRTESTLIVSHHHIGDKGGTRKHIKQRHDQHCLSNRLRAIHMNIATRTDLDVIDRDGTKGEQEKNQCRNNKHRISELICQLESNNGCKH